jgi:zinc finger protein
MTRILPIKIPFFKDILLESFSCENCGLSNNTVKSAGEIQAKGSRYTFKLQQPADFQRQIVRNDTGIFRIENIDLEMPPGPGQFTNLEGLFTKIQTDLQHDQPIRLATQKELHDALEVIIDKLKAMLAGTAFPITVSVDDPSGNSFIAPSTDDTHGQYARHDYIRTHAQNIQLGLATDDDTNGEADAITDAMAGVNVVDAEIYELPTTCPACTKPCTINAKRTNIPHFKEVIIMATVCDECGYRTSDVKTGGAVPEKGKRITLQVRTLVDLSRDILKSETAALKSTALGLEVQPGTLGGRFTTVEGLLAQVREQLHGQIFDTDGDLAGGDSMASETRQQWDSFFDKLDRAMKAEVEFDVTLEDPLANSFVQKNVDGDEEDPQIEVEEYERTDEENEELGLNDINVEGYESGHEREQEEEREAEAASTNGHAEDDEVAVTATATDKDA